MSESTNGGTIARFAIAFEAGIVIVAIFLGELVGIPPLGQMRITWTSVVTGVAATVPLLIGMWWCTRSGLKPLERLMNQVEEIVVPIFVGASGLTLLLVSILAGVGEEWLFRGVVQSLLTGWVGPAPALAVASALFGVAHLITPTYALLAGAVGAYLGGLFLLTDNLLVPVLVHALYDYAALTYLVSTRRRRSAIASLEERH